MHLHRVPDERWNRHIRHVAERQLVVLLRLLLVLAKHMLVLKLDLVRDGLARRRADDDVDGLGDLQASMTMPMPDVKRIIQLVSSLLSMRYRKMIIWTTTFVTICNRASVVRFLSRLSAPHDVPF